jgi:hypothetical protein
MTKQNMKREAETLQESIARTLRGCKARDFCKRLKHLSTKEWPHTVIIRLEKEDVSIKATRLLRAGDAMQRYLEAEKC